MEERMARIVNCKAILPIALFAIVIGSAFSGAAFADNQNGSTANANMVVTYVQGLHVNICGDHICSPSEIPQAPNTTEPVGGS